MKSKKGAEMTVGTIVIIVLALIVLVVLVLGFTGGWGNLWGRITSFFGGANVDSIVQACQMACTTSAKNDFCDRVRTLKTETPELYVDDKGKIIVGTEGATQAKKGEATCKFLADNSPKYVVDNKNLGFQKCDDITC